MVGYPTIAEFQQQFLGLVTPTLPGGGANPAYDDAQVNGTPDGRATQRNAFLQSAYRGADATFALVRSLLPANATSFVASDHGAAPQFLAIDASRVLVDLGLLSHPQTANCRPAVGETIGKAKACWAGGGVQIYLNLAGRDPVNVAFQQVAAADEASTVAQVKAAFLALADANDWTGDGQPEGWQLIDRAYTKAEARHVRNGAASTADMAHPTRTGDLVVFAFPPYQFDAATPGTPVARSAFFGQEGYAPDLQSIATGVNMRAAFFASGDAIRAQAVASRMRTIDVAPTIAYLMGIPEPQHAQGVVRLDLIRGGNTRTLVPIIGLTDFHGQLEPTTFDLDGRLVPVGGAAELATLFDEEGAAFGGNALLLSSGDNVGASPMNSGFLADRPAIDVENAWGVDASAYGVHEFDYGIGRLLQHQARASFPFLGANIVDAGTLAIPSWVRGTHILNYGGIRIGVIGIALKATPVLGTPGATAGLQFLDELQAIRTASETLRAMGVVVQIVLLHDGTDEGRNAIGGTPAVPWKGPAITIAEGLSDTTVDAILAGESHRIANSMVGKILVVQGLAAGASYSVVQLVVGGSDVEWSGGSTRVAKSLGVARRGDVTAIVDAANAELATLHNSVIGTQQFDLLRDPTRLHESAMGNLVADAMRSRYAGVDAALTNSGSLRANLLCAPPSAGEPPCAITLGEAYAVLPFGNTTVIETLTGAQLQQALQSGFSPMCDPAVATGRFPQVSGLKVTYTCNGTTAVVTGMWLTPGPPRGGLFPIGASTPVRIVTDSFLFSGGDGYAVLEHGTNVQSPSHDVLQVTVDYIGAHSPVGTVVEGRIVGP